MDDVQAPPSSIRVFGDAPGLEGASSPAQKTFIVFGVPRGGTTMVARVVEKLGVVMGTNLPLNYEDHEFNYDKMSDELKQDPEQMARGLMRAINRRNNRFDVWGWKYPRVHLYLPKIIKHVRNPHLICVFRDPVASALRPLSRRQSPKNPSPLIPTKVVKQHLDWQTRNIQLIHKLSLPSFLCSYEKSIADPASFVGELASFIGAPDDAERLDAAVQQINPGGYMQS